MALSTTRRWRRQMLYAATASLLAACGGEARTEVVVSVTTDLAVPADLDRLVITAAGPSMDIQTARTTLASPDDLPATLGLVRESGPLGPFDVTVEGFAGDGSAPVLARRARFYFQLGQTLELPIRLARGCLLVSCAGDETCEAGECRPIDVMASELLQWPASDSGMSGDAAIDSASADSAGLDGSFDAGRDGGDGAAGDGAITDTGAPTDAPLPVSCDDTYGAVTEYQLCEERAAECEFFTSPAASSSCDTTCEATGGGCIGSYEARNRGGGRCDRATLRDCAAEGAAFICICTRL